MCTKQFKHWEAVKCYRAEKKHWLYNTIQISCIQIAPKLQHFYQQHAFINNTHDLNMYTWNYELSQRNKKKNSLKKQVFTIYSSELWQINMIKRKKTGIFLYILLYVWLHYKSENILKLYLTSITNTGMFWQ